MTTIDKITFKSPINVDNGYTNTPQGEHESTMELYQHPGNYKQGLLIGIEWVVETLGWAEQIGIEWGFDNFGKKVVTGYDGVFELPEQAIQLLERNGFNCEEVKN